MSHIRGARLADNRIGRGVTGSDRDIIVRIDIVSKVDVGQRRCRSVRHRRLHGDEQAVFKYRVGSLDV